MPKVGGKTGSAAVASKPNPAKLNKGPKQQKGETKEARPVIHPEIESELCVGDESLTVEYAKQLLGWIEETKKGEFGSKYLLEHNKKKVRCTNNETNRPLYMASVSVLKQEILRKRWRLNGEPIIIGRTGLILNGQHTLIALILAADEWAANSEAYPEWETEPTLEKVIILGIAEDDDTVNTMDTAKPRSLADVIYRAEYFKKLPANQQKGVSKMLDSAIRKLWERSGVYEDAYGVARTHTESIAFLNRHPKLVNAVRHIYEEDNNENRIGKHINRGFAAAALYLMACSKSDSDAYYKSDNPNEAILDMSHWERACEFFVELAGGSKTLKAVPEYLAQLNDEHGKPPQAVEWAVIAKAWDAYKDKKAVTVATVNLKFEFKDDDHHLAETPYFGGIDVGPDGLPFDELSEEQLAVETENVREDKKPKKSYKAPKSEKTSAWKKGDTGFIVDGFDEPTFVTLLDEPYKDGEGIERVRIDVSGAPQVVPVDSLSLSRHELESPA